MTRTFILRFIAVGFLLSLPCLGLAYNPDVDVVKNVGNETCLECHEDHGLSKMNIHSRILDWELSGIQKGCEACHGLGDAHIEEGDPSKIFSFANASADESSQACLKCHRALQTTDWNLSDHALNEIDCSSCHTVHDGKEFVKEDPKLCLDCHQDVTAKMNFPSRHPIREGKMKCSSCHQHHGSLVKNLKTTERINDLCLNCHADKQGPFIYEHAPVVEDCTICHDAHGTVANNLLRQNEPFLCLQCHESHFHAGREGLTHPKSLPAGGHSDNPFGEAGWRRAYLTKCSQCHFQIHGTDNPAQTVPGKGKGLIR
jgi:DmsE family decaheme c-type cytochrome